MSRRVNLPGAAELFRTTGTPADARPLVSVPDAPATPRPEAAPAAADPAPSTERDPRRSGDGVSRRSPVRRSATRAERRPSGRERHEEKITVYVSAEELLDLEQARLVLRAEHGLGVDRGRIVREALAVVLADLDENGSESTLVRRLRGV